MEIEETTEIKTHKIAAVWGILIYILVFFVGMIPAGLLLMIPLGLEMTGVSPNAIQLAETFSNQIAMLGASFFAAWFVLRFIDGKSFSYLGFSLKGRKDDLILGLIVALSIIGLCFLILIVSGSVDIYSVDFEIPSLILSFIVFIMVAFAEEVMCRGYILGRMLDTKLNPFLSLLISAVIFAAMHAINPNFGLVPFINLILAGMLLGISYIYTRNLWFPISLHLFWNWFQGPIFGFEVSGQELFPSLFGLDRTENNLFNGGSFGLEGSLLCSAFMIGFTVLLGLYYAKKKKLEECAS